MTAGALPTVGAMLIAEEFVLITLEQSGTLARGASNHSAAATGVTGALITELAIDGHLDLTDGRIRLTGTRPDHPLLAQVLDNVAPHEGKKLKRRLSRIKHSGWNEVVGGLIDQGVIGRQKPTLRPTRHPVADPGAHAALLAEVRQAATATSPLDERMATLLALAGPCQQLEVVAPDRADRKAAKERIDNAADQVPATDAVRAAIQAAQAAAMAAGATAAVAGSS